MRRQTVRLVTTTRSTISVTAPARSAFYCPVCGEVVETMVADEPLLEAARAFDAPHESSVPSPRHEHDSVTGGRR